MLACLWAGRFHLFAGLVNGSKAPRRKVGCVESCLWSVQIGPDTARLYRSETRVSKQGFRNCLEDTRIPDVALTVFSIIAE